MPAMNVALSLLMLLPGLALGSFLNVVAARVPRHESIAFPGSHCMTCGHAIAWYDNIPLVSYIVLRGRCRNCGSSIGLRYPAVELVTALLVAGCVLKFGLHLEALLAVFFCAVLVAISAADFEHRIVPNAIVLPAAVITLAAQTALHLSVEWTIAAFAASGFLLLTALLYPGGMGMGDVKLAFLLGAMLGRTVIVAFAAGMLSALVPSIWLFIRHGSKARKMKIPFAPFLALGAVLALFAGKALIDAYLSLL
jgi:leader peptidase (prepilin peptidase)/N-methyltransferase